MDIPLLIVIAIVGVGAATLLMHTCARLAGVEGVTIRASIIAACGFGLPLAGAAQLMTGGVGTIPALLLLGAAILLGLWIIRTAYATTWGRAGMTWIMHLSIWIIFGAFMWRARG